MKTKTVLIFILCLLIPQLAGGLGSLFTTTNLNPWYSTLIKPSFNPPSWIFGPVWTLLFLLMGVSLFLIWRTKHKHKIAGYLAFALQLVFNVFWSYLFFGLQNPTAAFIEILILWSLILLNLGIFYKINKPSAYLLIPYLLWVTFAVVLNYSLMLLNK